MDRNQVGVLNVYSISINPINGPLSVNSFLSFALQVLHLLPHGDWADCQQRYTSYSRVTRDVLSTSTFVCGLPWAATKAESLITADGMAPRDRSRQHSAEESAVDLEVTGGSEGSARPTTSSVSNNKPNGCTYTPGISKHIYVCLPVNKLKLMVTIPICLI